MSPPSQSTSITIPTSIPIAAPDDPSTIYPRSTLSPELKKELETKVTHDALIIPARLTAQLRQSLSSVLMQRPKMKDVYPLIVPDDVMDGVDPKSERKLVLHTIVSDEANSDAANANADNDSIYSHEAIKSLLQRKNNNDDSTNQPKSQKDLYKNIRKSKHNVIIGYDDYTVEQVLSKLLPPSLCKEIPSSFEVVGMIAHLNLRAECLPYKFIIGRVILDKNKSIQVCVNKTGTIQNEFRTFPMEIIADDRMNNSQKGNGGKNKNNNNGNSSNNTTDSDALLEVEVREDGCKFKLDFEKVYWNSRLQYEHRRIVHLIAGESRPTNVKQRQSRNKSNQSSSISVISSNSKSSSSSSKEKNEIIVADACAGIGPFAVPLTSQYQNHSKGSIIKVYANDLNPTSFKYLNINSKRNKCQNLHTFNMDGRYFIRKLDEEGICYNHVLMNLPAIAPEFLNVFRGSKRGIKCSDDGNSDNDNRPWIHVHCFGGKGDGANEEAMARCSKSLGCMIDKVNDEVSVHIVRDVSPKKNMLCVSFRLPEGVKDLERIDEFGSVTVDDNDTSGGGSEKDEKEEKVKENKNQEDEENKQEDEPSAKRARTETS